MRKAFVILLALVVIEAAHAAQTSPDGNFYLDADPTTRIFLFLSMKGGFDDALTIFGNRDQLNWHDKCLDGRPGTQLKAMFEKYLDENPQMWDMTLGVIYFSMLSQWCQLPPKVLGMESN